MVWTDWIEWCKWMKHRIVELIFIWIIYLALLGRNSYKHNITYIPKKHIETLHWIYTYIHNTTDIYIYIREAHTDTGTYILYDIHIEEVHKDITTLTEAT